MKVENLELEKKQQIKKLKKFKRKSVFPLGFWVGKQMNFFEP